MVTAESQRRKVQGWEGKESEKAVSQEGELVCEHDGWCSSETAAGKVERGVEEERRGHANLTQCVTLHTPTLSFYGRVQLYRVFPLLFFFTFLFAWFSVVGSLVTKNVFPLKLF